MKKKQVIVEIYDLSVTVYVGDKKEVEAKLNKVRPGLKAGYGLSKSAKTKYDRAYEIYLRNDQKKHSISSILVHELFHVVDRITEKMGAGEEKECRAYLMGYLFEKFEKFIQAM